MPYANPVSGIYAIRRADRSYIGSSSNIRSRWCVHRSQLRRGVHRTQHLQNAWNKYGEDAFEFVVLEECSVEQLLEREQHYFDLHSDKYNHLPVAGSRRGVPHSDGTKAKIATAHRGRVASPEARARMSAAKMGSVMSPEARANMSASKMGNKNALGHVASEETRSKMSAAQKARWARQRAGDAVGCST